ncbi:MAG: DUF2807 domain-containing protein [Flavobacteriales bacterium]|nr:DUF2807 domain-containing protein [Flavobacteriales bacterium]
MQKLVLFLSLVIFSSLSFSKTIERDLDSFEKIRVTGNFKVILKKSDKEKIEIVNNDPENQEAEFITEKDKDGVMDIMIKGDKGGQGNDSMSVTIYYKTLNYIEAKRGAWLKFEEKVSASDLTLEIRSGGQIITELECENLNATIKAGGSMRLHGKATKATYLVSAGGEIYGFKLDSEDIYATIKAGGDISVTGKNVLDCTILTTGVLNYKGDPKSPNFVNKLGKGGEFRKINS